MKNRLFSMKLNFFLSTSFIFFSILHRLQPVNLHLSSEQTLSDNSLQNTILTKIQTQLLSISGYSLLCQSVLNSTIQHSSFIQQLVSSSFTISYSGRINNESDLVIFEIAESRKQRMNALHTLNKALQIIYQSSYSSTTFTINDLQYLLERRTDTEQFGLLIAFGHSGLLRKIPFHILKLKLMIPGLISNSQDRYLTNQNGDINYKIECGVSYF